jgi:hypothetical protein
MDLDRNLANSQAVVPESRTPVVTMRDGRE